MEQKYQVILTGVSGSGKSTIMEELLDEYPNKFARPIQYTTRQPRNDKELDSYVFLTREQFFTKLENGDFIEFTEYNGHLYAISAIIDTTRSNIFIVEPVGRAAIKKHFHLNGIPYKGFYLEINEDEVQNRLMNRGDTVKAIKDRLKDFKYFSQEVDDKVLDATLPTARNVRAIAQAVGAL